MLRRLAFWAMSAVVAGMSVGVASAAPASAAVAVPSGYRVVEQVGVAAGVTHLRLVRERGPVVAHVARIEPGAPVDLRAVLSNERVGLPAPALERTSEMCRRVACVVAVNADFFSLDSGEPVGGLIAGGQLLRSPNTVHHQLSIGPGGLSAGTVTWTGQLMPSDLRPLVLDGLNVARESEKLVLYTPAKGPSTATNPFGTELVVQVVEPSPPLRLGQTALVELVELREASGDTPIPAGGAVLSGHGKAAAALTDLWSRVQSGAASRRGLLRLEAGGNPFESVGGTPILLRDGQRWVAPDNSAFVKGLHPRTVVGWNAAGEVFLVTVDGRQPGYSVGLSLSEAADLVAGLGATDAINLDGGGSTTFVRAGNVTNQPSDRLVRRDGGPQVIHQAGRGDAVVGSVERPVAVALAIVPRSASEPLRDPLGGTSPRLPLAPGIQLAAGPDPGSDPNAGVPALVGVPNRSQPADSRLVALATLANVAVAVGAVRCDRGARLARAFRRR